MDLLFLLLQYLWDHFKCREDLLAEITALRQQLLVYKRKGSKRPKLNKTDRLFWVALSRVWQRWREVLLIVQPKTVIEWHRRCFRHFWRWRSKAKSKPGRPPIPKQLHGTIVEMAKANPRWGAPRIHGELKALGIEVSESTVSNILSKLDRPPSQKWSTFIENHCGGDNRLVSCDFFTVMTLTFRILYCYVILDLDRRKIVAVGVAEKPSSAWVAKIVDKAFPVGTEPGYLLRDRDKTYGKQFSRVLQRKGVKELLSAPRSPKMNAYCERLIGTIRREALDHHIILDEQHLLRVMERFVEYYHQDRTHLSLQKETPFERQQQEKLEGFAVLVEEPRLGGLHHRYYWDEAA